MVLASFVSMTQVYNFFELMGDMLRNKIPLLTMFTYLFFLTPQLIYELLPISVLVAVLVTFGVLSKQNEVTAFKACGVSLYRLATAHPGRAARSSAAGCSPSISTTCPAPTASRTRCATKSRAGPSRPICSPDRKWIMGKDSRIYYYKYFDPAEKVMVRGKRLRARPEHASA